MISNVAALTALIYAVVLIVYPPILKPWFGFRRPKGNPGRWFE